MVVVLVVVLVVAAHDRSISWVLRDIQSLAQVREESEETVGFLNLCTFLCVLQAKPVQGFCSRWMIIWLIFVAGSLENWDQ